MELAERSRFERGGSDLLLVAMREEKSAESARKLVKAMVEERLALAELDAITMHGEPSQRE